jgi:sugar phosphate isomerase/epimerase
MLSLAYITVDHADPIEQIEAAAAAGFDAVGLRALMPTGRPLAHELIDRPVRVRAVAEACRAHGMAILDLEVATLTADFWLDAVLPFLDVAAELGALWVQLVGEDADRQRATENCARFAEAAAARGRRVALEFMRFRSIDSLATATAVLDHVDDPSVALLIDALHLMRSGGQPADLAALPPERIAYLQLCDAPAAPPADGDYIFEARANRLYPGEGGLPLVDIVRALPLETPISLEVPYQRLAQASVTERALSAAHATRDFFRAAALADRWPGAQR